MMTDSTELTNIPDYQKIIQTSQTKGNKAAAKGWSEEVETLTPSPVVKQPYVSLEDSQPGLYKSFPWQDKQNKDNFQSLSPLMGAGHTTPPDSRPQYRSTGKSPVVKEIEGSYRVQGFVKPAPSYATDANQKGHPILRQKKISPSSIQRRSFTEGFPIPNSSNYGDDARLNSLFNQRNHHTNVFGSSVKVDGRPVFNDIGQHRDVRKNFPLARHQEEHKDFVGISVSSKTPQEDLRHWQQFHQEELLHQHLETQALYETPPNQILQDQVLVDPSFAQLSVQDVAPAQWEPVKRAADNIIREKNMIIDKLKNRILELEGDFKMSETKLRQSVKTNQDDNNLVRQKLQESQHNNMLLKERMDEERAQRNSEIDDLEVKLGATEHDVQKLKEMLGCKEKETAELEAKIVDTAQEAASWRQQFENSIRTHQGMKKKLDSLQHYLNDLPTVDESRLQATEILTLREENLTLKSRIDAVEKKLNQARRTMTTKDFTIRELEDKERELQSLISTKCEELDRLKDADGFELHKAQKDVQTLQADKEMLNTNLDKAKKLLETTHMKLYEMESRYKADLTKMEERMTQEVEVVGCLKAEIASKDELVEQLKRSIKELGNQSQELLHQRLIAKESARHLEAGNAEATVEQHGRLLSQMGHCLSELQTLVDVCIKQLQGEEPDISMLLGFQDSGSHAGNLSSKAEQDQTVQQYFMQLEDLRRQVNKLRMDICNKYAEDMGNKVHCTTQ